MSESSINKLDIHNIYPSIDELVTPEVKDLLPHSLVETLAERYAGGGLKYMTDVKHEDGRPVNQIALREDKNLLSMLEEVDDAIFNWLGWALLEYRRIDLQEIANMNPRMIDVLDSLIACYKSISLQRRDSGNA